MSDAAVAPRGPLPRPELYTEREIPRIGAADRIVRRLEGMIAPAFARARARRLARIVPEVRAAEVGLALLDDLALAAAARDVARWLRSREVPALKDAARAFAIIREASGRVLGQQHRDVQLMGGYALLSGMIAEMNTGEGKTLTATLAAIGAALSGKPVHVITVNDYLVQRDAEKLGPLYRFFGLSVGVVVEGMEADARRAAYACDVTYCTNKELAFDYLKDRLVLASAGGNLRRKLKFAGRTGEGSRALLMRGLHFCIVDEADSVMIDEARTPLILSGEADSASEAALYREALAIAGRLEPDRDFRIVANERRVDILPAGLGALEREGETRGGVWLSPVHREDLVGKALSALHVMLRDEQYILAEGKVAIVDEYTGRVMADRFWSDGLHQMVEIKEGLAPSPRRVTLARLTYQRLFRRYQRLSGMSGTVREIAGELWEVYRLPVARIPTHKPRLLKLLTDVIYATAEARWVGLAKIAARLQARGAPVLIGTRSVAASQIASRHLDAVGVVHRVLNAADETAEADIVAGAGLPGCVTVATNMAGRGTDILLGPGVAEAGGLVVIMTERHDAQRIDRQLFGRAGRQGDPGVSIALLSLDDQLLAEAPLAVTQRVARRALGWNLPRVARLAMRRAQKQAEREHARIRRELLKSDSGMDDALAFAGAPD
jgi:preprotein translocase subunit SecA